MKYMNRNGFTLIEMLVTMTIIAILAGVSIFALQGARVSGRDAKRKADLETIRSALELHKADCGVYPGSLGANIRGTLGSCTPMGNTYLEEVPKDPLGALYCYHPLAGNSSYEMCATLEDPPTSPESCSCGGNYKVTP
jgi:type II secretion system protein G